MQESPSKPNNGRSKRTQAEDPWARDTNPRLDSKPAIGDPATTLQPHQPAELGDTRSQACPRDQSNDQPKHQAKEGVNRVQFQTEIEPICENRGGRRGTPLYLQLRLNQARHYHGWQHRDRRHGCISSNSSDATQSSQAQVQFKENQEAAKNSREGKGNLG